VGRGAIAGKLVDAEVFVEVFEVVFLDPAVEDEAHGFMSGTISVENFHDATPQSLRRRARDSSQGAC
jgi:hypothetical protein